jgi:hypothetical protein
VDFVGREKETKQIQRALERGENIILGGKYGIGRTSLARHVARCSENRWNFIFLDFSQTPGKICRHLIKDLLPEEISRGRKEAFRYKASRFRITDAAFRDPRPVVLVLDNIAKLSVPKMEFIRRLANSGRFRFLAIVESFLKQNELFLLRSRLSPAWPIQITHLSRKEVGNFFRLISVRYGWPLTENKMEMMAQSCGGYPLRMKEMAQEKMGNPELMKEAKRSSLDKTWIKRKSRPGNRANPKEGVNLEA